MTVRLDGPADGPENMRRDLALGDGLTGWAARVYAWQGAWASLGRSQTPEAALVPGCQVPWVCRPTGGGGVLHGHDVTVALAARLDALGAGVRDLRAVYRAMVRPLAAAMDRAGSPARLAGEAPDAGTSTILADCFAGTSPLDIVDPVSGRKACGCAMRVYPRWVLVQASIPAAAPLCDPSAVFRGAATPSWRPLDPAALAEALEAAIAQALETRAARSL